MKHFWKILFLKIFTSVLTHFVWEKIDFEIFNFLDESEDSERFLKNSIFEHFYKCFDPFCMGKKYWIADFQFSGWIIGKKMTSEKSFSHVWRKNYLWPVINSYVWGKNYLWLVINSYVWGKNYLWLVINCFSSDVGKMFQTSEFMTSHK